MDIIAVAAIVTPILGQGLLIIGKKMLERGVAEPAADAIRRLVGRKSQIAQQDKRLQGVVEFALLQTKLSPEDHALLRELLGSGLSSLASDNDQLRQDVARAALLLTRPDPRLVPESLIRQLNWPRSRMDLLTDFLFAVHQGLATNEDWGVLVHQADREEMRILLSDISTDVVRTANASEKISGYVKTLLEQRGIAPDKDDARALEDYLSHVLESHSHLSFLFIKPAGSSNLHGDVELETVFVPLQVDDPAVGYEETARVEPLIIADVLARHKVFLLIGKPGSGKTTLLRYLAVSFARGEAVKRLNWTKALLLPIIIPLRNFGRFLEAHDKEFTNPAPGALRHFIEDYFAQYELELPPRFFRDRLDEGSCLILLDGLDEVSDRSLRARVAQMVSAFVRHYAARGNRVGLASRPDGYREVAQYLSKPVVCTVQDLTPEGRDELVTNLLKVLEPNEWRCREQTEELLRDIRAKSEVDKLSIIPLFCTTLVLVYKYRGTTLPERRVDVYHELVDLLLGFWETHKAEREGTADVRDLVLMDGTGRSFMNEREAVEAKKLALVDLAGWMQQRQMTIVPRLRAAARLARFFRRRQGASRREDGVWACNFLALAHERSGLFVEASPNIYAFSHKGFLEYLAATDIIERVDPEPLQLVLAHAHDASWDEVILLATAHPGLSPRRRERLLDGLLDAHHLILAGRCAVVSGKRLPEPTLKRIERQLHEQLIAVSIRPQDRYVAGEILDELSWLPDDLNAWVYCSGCAGDGSDLMVARYPVTNYQFERFIRAGGYETPGYWGGEESAGWRWRFKVPDYRTKGPAMHPRHWQNARFGKQRRGYPVVGISWYEATAYCAWLSSLLVQARSDASLAAEDRELIASLVEQPGDIVRLPTDGEWLRLAGGSEGNRYPWNTVSDPRKRMNEEQSTTILMQRMNTREADIHGTSPVGMYPLGVSQPFSLMDLAGNVWEWTNTWYDEKQTERVLRGGSWDSSRDNARCTGRGERSPHFSDYYIGFRVVFPTVAVSEHSITDSTIRD